MHDPTHPDAGPGATGRLLNLQRMSTEDGPGIRTTAFFKGCGLACTWCHNPESISARPEVVWYEHKCIGCDLCRAACVRAALARSEAGLARDRERCQACGACVEACPTTAQHLFGQTWSAPDLVAELLKDRAYYDRSGGGVTLSGGEPVLQPAFAAAVLDALRTEGVHTALDTSGHCGRAPLLDLAARCDLVLYDLKLMDDAAHRRATGQGNGKVLANLEGLAGLVADRPHGPAIWIRTPLVPGLTDSAENIRAIGLHLRRVLGDRLQRWDLLPFNDLCREQYGRLGRRWAFAATSSMPSAEGAERLRAAALDSGWPEDRVFLDAAAPAAGE